MSTFSNNLTPAQVELLAILAEECAEVVQSVCKVLRHGYESTNNGKLPCTNREDLEREMGDLRAAMILLCESGDADKATVHHYADRKLKAPRYTHHQPERSR
jgi:NTP pyrophosphatase (non-canonical NTP hydrolase)